MTPNAATAHIRRLACLGLQAGAAMPDVLDLITHVVPSANNVFIGTDESFTCRSIVSRHWTSSFLETLVAKRYAEYREACDAHEQWWRGTPSSTVVDEECAAYAGLHGSPMYFECLRPFDQHYVLEGMVRRGSTPVGYLDLFRDSDAPRFGARDTRRLTALLPYLAMIMSDTARADVEHAPVSGGAVLIVDSHGALQSISAGGEKLLRYAFNPELNVHADTRAIQASLVKRLLRQLRASTSGTGGSDCSPPFVEVRNGHGLFTFRAHWLVGEEDVEGAHACIVVNHAEPLPLRLMRGLAALPLSPAQKSVALLIARAQSRKSMARELGVSDGTVKDYVRLIYRKLGIHDRHQLTAALLSAGESAARRH